MKKVVQKINSDYIEAQYVTDHMLIGIIDPEDPHNPMYIGKVYDRYHALGLSNNLNMRNIFVHWNSLYEMINHFLENGFEVYVFDNRNELYQWMADCCKK